VVAPVRLLATMPVRDEAARYLDPVLDWLVNNVTAHVAVYDDRSDDNTVAVARDHGCHVCIRPPDSTPFLEDESKFREEAWRWLEVSLDPQPGEWVLAIDADEFFIADDATVESDKLHDVIARADAEQADAVMFPRHEVFGFDIDGIPMIRTDGWWAHIVNQRLVRWMAGGSFNRQGLAGGSLPEYVRRSVFDRRTAILHFGYATTADRQAKHDRYIGREGHSRDHIDSILAPPKLERWTGKVPILGGSE